MSNQRPNEGQERAPESGILSFMKKALVLAGTIGAGVFGFSMLPESVRKSVGEGVGRMSETAKSGWHGIQAMLGFGPWGRADAQMIERGAKANKMAPWRYRFSLGNQHPEGIQEA